MRYSTIVLAIDKVLMIVNMIKTNSNREEIYSKIRNLYDSSGKNN
jgi:hypothetical protein